MLDKAVPATSLSRTESTNVKTVKSVSLMPVGADMTSSELRAVSKTTLGATKTLVGVVVLKIC